MLTYYYQSLYRQRENERSVAWAMLSVAIRISMSLGLHQNIGYVHDTSIYGSEVKRRLWWSLCEFDNWSSCMLGHSSGLGCMGDAVSLPSQVRNVCLLYTVMTTNCSRNSILHPTPPLDMPLAQHLWVV